MDITIDKTLNDETTCKNYAVGNITKQFDNGSDYDVIGKTLFIDGNVVLFQFNIKLNVDHIVAGTYFEFLANIQAVKSVISHDTMFIRAGIDCLIYGRFQNATSLNLFDIMLYFTNDYNRDPSISGDIILYTKFICFCGDYIFA